VIIASIWPIEGGVLAVVAKVYFSLVVVAEVSMIKLDLVDLFRLIGLVLILLESPKET
jgi:hypothetical protein